MSIATFDQWKENKEKLECIPLYLDRDFVLNIQSCIKTCERKMLEIDQARYTKYVKDKEKYIETQTKIAFDQYDTCEGCQGSYLLDHDGVMIKGDCNCQVPWNFQDPENEQESA